MASTIILSDNGASSGSAGVKSTGGNDGVLILQTTTAGGAATNAVYIDATQKVGFGTTSPSGVVSTAVADGAASALYLERTGGSPSTLSVTFANAYANLFASGVMALHTAGSQRLAIDTSGNITSSTSEAYLYFTSNYSVGANTRASIRTVGAGGGSGYGGDLRFSTRKSDNTWNADAVTIAYNGDFLVGATSGFTSSKAYFVSGTNGYWGSLSKGTDYVKSSMATGSSAYMDFFYYNNTTASYAGYISIAAGVTTYATSSDARLKENIVDAPSALESVNNIQVRSFDWKNGVGSVEYGVIAQELYEVAPEGVSVGKDKEDGEMEIAWGFDGSKLVPRLIKAIQEQQALITTLTERITALEAK
jgi:hypothetical protein